MNDRDYYRARAEQEMALADRADRPEVRRIHRQLAERYRLHADAEQSRLRNH